jgi:peptide/nickel transport system permease protein
MTVPGIAILVIIAANVGQMTITIMGLTVAVLAWMGPTRSIRAQVLTLRERSFVHVARSNGESELEVVFREVMPNLIPYVAAAFISAVNHAMLASVGLEVLGLGANDQYTLGTAIYWSQKYSAVLRGQWWWWGPPIAVISIIFVGMFFLSSGLDRFANPRLRQRT